MTTLHAETALTPQGWEKDVRVVVRNGVIEQVVNNAVAHARDDRVGALLPALCNLHSHAFQRGMAGLAEVRGTAADSFWTWRDVMYRFALTLSPDEMEAIAAQAYAEMLEAGFARVGEFHYLHHDHDGRPYADIGELAGRMCAASVETGIGLTLLPVFYAQSNFGGAPPHHGQRRFISDVESFAHLVDRCEHHAKRCEGSIVGIAPHSLRAVTADDLKSLQAMRVEAPIHMHIAEQTREVDDCVAWSGQRPVAWLLDHAAVDPRWCLIHATHMTAAETLLLAKSGAVAGLCPMTEASLGDGIFNGADYVQAGGHYGVGTDSNILIDAAGELRQFEYTQRLALRSRNVLARNGGSTGRALFDTARRGGAQALGVLSSAIAVGERADFISLDLAQPALAGRQGDSLLDSWIFAGGRVDAVWTGGVRRVANGRHIHRERIAKRFAEVMQRVMAAL